LKQWLVLIVLALCYWGAFEIGHYWLVHDVDMPDQHTLKVYHPATDSTRSKHSTD
jgi:hypothetical protein